MSKEINRLHYLTQDLETTEHWQQAEIACKAGVRWVQFRMKNTPYQEWLEAAQKVKKVCDEHEAILIVNDDIEIAKNVKAHGVHLGKNDLHPTVARNVLGKKVIIGVTANSKEDLERVQRSEVDYVGVGPFKYTETKENLAEVLGASGIADLQKVATKPLIAIGGISIKDIEDVEQTGVHGLAVSSAINLDENPGYAAQLFNERVLKWTN